MQTLIALRSLRRAAVVLNLGALIVFGSISLPAQTLTNVTVRVMAANLSSGDNQCYEAPGLRILQALKPDIVAIQEFSYVSKPSTTVQMRSFVNAAFGTNYVYARETNASYSVPNGIVSRHPILASGSWEDHDPGVNDRGFAWARIALPGTNELYVVSVHLKASSGSSNEARRAAEAAELKALISTNFPSNAWIIVAGDMNLYSDSEGAITTFKTFLSDSPVPTDTESEGSNATNEGRTQRYDRVLVSFSLTNCLTNVVIGSRSFPNGLVFDSAVYVPLSEVAPVASADSHVSGMQHMAVVKDFRITYTITNQPVVPSPTLAMPSPGLLQWQGLSNLTYTVQSRTSLLAGSWQSLSTTSSPTGILTFSLPETNAPHCFFRVVTP